MATYEELYILLIIFSKKEVLREEEEGEKHIFF